VELKLTEFPELSSPDDFTSEVLSLEAEPQARPTTPASTSAPSVAPKEEAAPEEFHPPPSVDDKVVMTIGDFRVSFFRSHKRLNVEHLGTGETLAIKQGGQDASGDWIVDATESGDRVVKGTPFRYRAEALKSGCRLSLVFAESHVTLTFDM